MRFRCLRFNIGCQHDLKPGIFQDSKQDSFPVSKQLERANFCHPMRG